MDREDHSEVPSSAEEPPYQAIAPNLDKFSRASLQPGSVSRRRIGRAVIVLSVLLLAVIAFVAWSIYLA